MVDSSVPKEWLEDLGHKLSGIFKPSIFQPGRIYPGPEWIYPGGPHAPKDMVAWLTLMPQGMARRCGTQTAWILRTFNLQTRLDISRCRKDISRWVSYACICEP